MTTSKRPLIPSLFIWSTDRFLTELTGVLLFQYGCLIVPPTRGFLFASKLNHCNQIQLEVGGEMFGNFEHNMILFPSHQLKATKHSLSQTVVPHKCRPSTGENVYTETNFHPHLPHSFPNLKCYILCLLSEIPLCKSSGHLLQKLRKKLANHRY